MGASVIAYWPGITQEQLESQPGFFNDCKAWGDWMAEREQDPASLHALDTLGAGALRTFITDGVSESEVDWVTPEALEKAAVRLRELVLAKDPGVTPLLTTYTKSANGVDPIHEEFAQDLADVADIARFAKQEGVEKMTLEVNW